MTKADLIECASYACGGYYSSFKDLLKKGKHLNVGFPIAEVDYDGTCVLTKEDNTSGCITVSSVTSQLLYEIQGPMYYGSDVVAELEEIQMEQVSEDRVKITGVKGRPPPPITKIGYVLHRRISLKFRLTQMFKHHGTSRLPSRIPHLPRRCA